MPIIYIKNYKLHKIEFDGIKIIEEGIEHLEQAQFSFQSAGY